MFRWYRNAARCYAYLTDVSTTAQTNLSGQSWQAAFEESRWFTRGWTLQELIAPPSVEFFCSDGRRLGDKKSLERQLHKITGIPVSVLWGGPVVNFSFDERVLWARNRETTREEDLTYSLLGIFDISIPVIYGEGRENAFRRLKREWILRVDEVSQAMLDYAKHFSKIQQRLKLNSRFSIEDDQFTSMAFPPDSRLLASASTANNIKLWDTATGVLLQMWKGHRSSVKSIAFSQRSRLLVSTSGDETVRVWDTTTGELQQVFTGCSCELQSVAFSPDSKLLLAAASSNHTVSLWDAFTGVFVPRPTFREHSNSVTTLVLSHDSRLLASASRDRTMRLWGTTTGMLLLTLERQSAANPLVAFSADSKLLASVSYRRKDLQLWDVESGVLKQTLEMHGKSVASVAFSPDSRYLASVGLDDPTVQLWNIGTDIAASLLIVKGHTSTGAFLAFSPDSRLLAVACGDTIRLYGNAART